MPQDEIALGTISALTLFVGDIKRAKQFYAEVFGQRLVFEDDVSAAFRFDNTIVNLLQREAAPELIEPAQVAAPGSGATLQLTIAVDDTDAVCEALRERGVTLLNGPVNRPWGPRTAAFADPDGHVWEVAGDPSPAS